MRNLQNSVSHWGRAFTCSGRIFFFFSFFFRLSVSFCLSLSPLLCPLSFSASILFSYPPSKLHFKLDLLGVYLSMGSLRYPSCHNRQHFTKHSSQGFVLFFLKCCGGFKENNTNYPGTNSNFKYLRRKANKLQKYNYFCW